LLSPGRALPVVVNRNGAEIALTVTPTTRTENGEAAGYLDFIPDYGGLPVVVNEVQPGSKVLVDVTIKNTLDEEIAMTSFHELGLRELIILDGEGKPALTKLGQDIASGKEFLVGGHSKLFFVQPGKPEKEIITVRSDLYDLNRAGKYTLQVQRLDSVTKTWVKSNVITVSVTLTPNGGS